MDRQIQHILRTLERLRRLTYYAPEAIAEAISPHFRIQDVVEAIVHLEDVAKCMDKKMQWKCAECGRDMHANIDPTNRVRVFRRVRRNARYCSAKCRQKAYRKRKHVTATASDTKVKPSRVTGLPFRKAA
jgi:hypothetical protein